MFSQTISKKRKITEKSRLTCKTIQKDMLYKTQKRKARIIEENSNNSLSPVATKTTEKVERHTAYSVSLKLAVVICAEADSNRAASRKYGIEETYIRRWRDQKQELQAIERGGCGTKLFKVNPGGRKTASTSLDNLILQWIKQKESEKIPLSTSMVRKKALEIAATNEQVKEELSAAMRNGESFLASYGWLTRLLARNSISIPKKLVGRKSLNSFPKEICQDHCRFERESYLIRNYILYLRSLRIKNKYDVKDILVMEETAILLDNPDVTSVKPIDESMPKNKKGRRRKERITICLTARGDGTKLRPWIVFKGEKLDGEVEQQDLPVKAKVSPTGFLNQGLTLEFLQSLALMDRRRLLVWNSARYHNSDETLKNACLLNIDPVVIPNGSTRAIQDVHVNWTVNFKAQYKHLYEGWLSNKEPSFTAAGELKRPSQRLICKWVCKAWSSISNEMITKNFKTCAITNATDGSEDNLVLCLKLRTDSNLNIKEILHWTNILNKNGGDYNQLHLEERSDNADLKSNSFDEENSSLQEIHSLITDDGN